MYVHSNAVSASGVDGFSAKRGWRHPCVCASCVRAWACRPTEGSTNALEAVRVCGRKLGQLPAADEDDTDALDEDSGPVCPGCEQLIECDRMQRDSVQAHTPRKRFSRCV